MIRRKKKKAVGVENGLPVQIQEHLPVVVDTPRKKHTMFYIVCAVVLIIINIGLWFCFASESTTLYFKEFAAKTNVIRLKPKVDPNALAIVNGQSITMEDMQELMLDMPQLAELPMETVYPNLLNMLINNKVIMIGAKKAGVAKRPAIKRMLRQAEEQIIGQTYLNELLESQISEEELRALYEREIKNFKREEEIHARHILVKTEKEAQDLLIQLKAGADFASLANQKSLDKNTQDGDLGYFTKGMMVPEFGDAVFDMKKGQLSNPIHTAFGWHIAYIEDKRLANPPSFEDVRDQIKQAVMENKLQSVLATERTKLNVQILKPTFE